MELLLPQDYVESTAERLSLYRELDHTKDEKQLELFVMKLSDRFGKLPKQSQELISAIRLRWIAAEKGFEKIVLKNRRMTCYFPENRENPFFQSPDFISIIDFVKRNPDKCLLKEKNEKLSLAIKDISSISSAIEWLNKS